MALRLDTLVLLMHAALVIAATAAAATRSPSIAGDENSAFRRGANHLNATEAVRGLLRSKVPKLLPRRKLAGCGSGNPIDACWQCDNWESNRQSLASCAIGFGSGAAGGRNGAIYVVTDPSDDNVIDPVPGTIRYAAVQTDPLWITFAHDMTITLSEELIVTSYKTFDGRGANVHIAYGACFTIQFVTNVIIHGLHIHNCKSTGPARIRSSLTHVGDRGVTDGDGISVFGSSNLWFDHNYLSSCADGLIDVIEGSDDVTISNNYFTQHDKVMLLGAHDSDYVDRGAKVTVAFNYFGPGLEQRMPRGRLGTFHVVNNYYPNGWTIYGVGGSGNPIINSEGNYFNAANSPKEVTSNLDGSGNWRSLGDLFVGGAYFTPFGASTSSPLYNKANSFSPLPASQVPQAAGGAGPL